MRIKLLLFKAINLAALTICAHAEIALTKIADGGTTVPGAPVTTFKNFNNPAIHNGQVVFQAVNSSDAPGIYLFNGSAIEKIADTNTAAPNGGNFVSVSFFAYGLENGVVAFVADDTNGPALFRWTNGVTTRLFKNGDAIPGTTTNKFTTFGQPAFDNGTLYFIGADSTNYRGVHRFDSVLSTGLVSSLQTYPTTALPHGFSSQLTVESNRFAVWSFASNNQPNAIFTWTNGVKNFLVSSNDAIPGAGANFYTFQSPPEMSGGTVAFHGGSVANFQEGIFLRPFGGGTITPVARRGDPNKGTSGTLTSFNGLAYDNNQAWFYAGGTGGESLFYWQSNNYSRVLSGGMKIGTRTIRSSSGFTIVPRGCQGGVATFVAKFTDLSSGLYLTTNLPPATNSLSLAVTNVVNTNTPLPGGTGFFTFMNSVRFWQDGVVFNGGGTNSQSGIYRYANGVYSVIVNRDTIFPGSTTNVNGFAVYAQDATRLLIGLSAPDGRQGIFIYDGNSFTLVADSNTAIPGGSFGNFTAFPGAAQFNGANVTFMASGTNNYSAVIEFNGNSLTRVVDSTTAFPGNTNSLRILNFARQGSLFGLTAWDGVSTYGALTYTNGSLTLLATNGAAIPGRPNRVFGLFLSPGFFGGELYFTAQASSTVDSFSGNYLMRTPAGGNTATVVVDENTYLPGLVAGASSLTYFIEPSGVFIQAANSIHNVIYYFNGSGTENLLDTGNPPNGVPLIGVTVSRGGMTTNGAALVTSGFNGAMIYYSPAIASGNPGGQFTPGSILYSPGSSFCVTFGGATSGNTYRIQYNPTPGSTNWVTFTNFTYTAPLTVCDSGASNQIRLYRAVSP